jgi:hypothetical protein
MSNRCVGDVAVKSGFISITDQDLQDERITRMFFRISRVSSVMFFGSHDPAKSGDRESRGVG